MGAAMQIAGNIVICAFPVIAPIVTARVPIWAVRSVDGGHGGFIPIAVIAAVAVIFPSIVPGRALAGITACTVSPEAATLTNMLHACQ